MKFNTALEFVDYAIDLTRERIKRNPSFPVYAAVINQLLYIKAVLMVLGSINLDFISFPLVLLRRKSLKILITSWREH